MAVELYSCAGEVILVEVAGEAYTIEVSGKGVPILTIGPGSAMHRTLSANFRENFQLHALDLYWIEKNSQPNFSSLSLAKILNDIHEVIVQLNLEKPILWGHSAFGIIALEFAKQFPDACSGVIMIGSPLNCNEEVDKENKAFFHKAASEDRLNLYKQRCKDVSQMRLDDETLARRFEIEYIYRDAPRYWAQMDFDCSHIWDGLLPPNEFAPLFNEILPAIEVRDNLSNLKCQVFLAAGMYDYDCCPWQWEILTESSPYLWVERFEHSGHYPHFEEQELFDNKIFSWLRRI